MRKLLFFTTVLLLMACADDPPIINLPAPDTGVVINGVRWATHNVAAPGTFVENPHDVGMFFQWNRQIGWTNNGTLINSNNETNWTHTNQAGSDWYVNNDPCPEGWRVPTEAELMSLRSARGSWTSMNGVYGRLFGTRSNGIFLPAAGWLNNGNAENRGALDDAGRLGLYWSRTISGNNQARSLMFSSSIAGGMRSNVRADGYNIRCVRAYVTGVTLNRAEMVLSVGGTEPLVATIEPANATNRNVTWTSSNSTIATVNANGVVTAVSLGTATITATTADGGKTASSTITVIELSTSLDGVVINGRRWATRNVGAPGTFADSPEDVGMFYQWNRRVGWYFYYSSLVNSNAGTTWNNSIPTGARWESQNDPCPQGWRVPTEEELYALRSGSIWMAHNGVNGRLFGPTSNGIFLPSAGRLNSGSGGALYDENVSGFYWSRTVSENNQARNLTFSSSVADMRTNARADGYSIRCVAE